jgi:DmsE family decaheme c-type cytochrome
MKMKTTLLIMVLLLGGKAFSSPVKVDEPKVCYACHDAMESLNKKRSVHTSFKQGICSACHNPHASKHAALIDEDIKTLCLSCHKNVKEEMVKLSAHQPALDGDCLTCHDPHASDYKNQLKQKTVALCVQCHTAVTGWMSSTTVHSPVKSENCAVCHTPHGSESEGLLVRSIPALCFSCHKQDAPFAAAHKGYNLSKADCLTCHDPHASSKPNLLMANQHAPFKAGTCVSCHTSGSESAFALVSEPKALCLKCHKQIQDDMNRPYHHNLNDSLSCLNCHNPHAAPASPLLAASQKELCFRCHFKGEKYKGKERSQYATHNDMDCSNCHTPHGGNDPKYLKSVGEDLCRGCHPNSHKGSHPMGGEVIDPRTNTTLVCTSCHKLHGADYKMYLPLDPERDLCIQCHKK